jgi:hypothetical protein
LPLDAIAAVPPQVTFENNQLTIVAPNSTLSDILRAVRKQTGADIDVPPQAQERVVTRLGPGPAREVLADLLNGSRFNYVLLGSPSNEAALTRVVLVPKTGGPEVTPNAVAQNNTPVSPRTGQPVETPEPDTAPDATEPEAADDNANNPDDNTEQQQQPAEADQNPPQEQNNGVKTPQQMLQEMQQRQMQLQQQQQSGQPPIPGAGMPPHPPQEN